MNSIQVKLNDLPELPFELILSYLSLEDRIKARVVSRRWYIVIDSFKPKSLCYSDRPSGFIRPKNHRFIGEFGQNFISSSKFGPFFQTFGQSIFTNLKHLRLCQLYLSEENTPAALIRILNSFGQLEELGLFEIKRSSGLGKDIQLRLNLPMLKSVQLVDVNVFDQLTLDAPSLKKVKHVAFSKVNLVHGESVEKLVIDNLNKMEVKSLKNLKNLHCGRHSRIDSRLLSTLEQLKEVHLHVNNNVSGLFQQKERYGRSNLKIFLFGFHLNAPDDPAIHSLCCGSYLPFLIENPSKVAMEIPFKDCLTYSEIEYIPPGLEIDLLSRFTDLYLITVDEPVQDVERFLELLKNLNNISDLTFEQCDQPQQLFDRLPDHCAIQELKIENAPADLDFLFGLKSLIHLDLRFPIDIESISKVLEELSFLSSFDFDYLKKKFEIRIEHSANDSKQFWVLLSREWMKVSDLNAAIEWISEKGTESEYQEWESESEDEE